MLKKYINPDFFLCDISQGMLERAKHSINYVSIAYYQDNMLDYLKKCENESLDIIICSWAIKYAYPKRVIAECRRVLKKNGYMTCIVNTKFTLPEMRKVLPKLFEANLQKISKVMLELPNPISIVSFDRWFLNAGFERIVSQKDQHSFHFKSTKELVNFAISTGALAGYDQMLNLGEKSIVKQMNQYVRQCKIHQLTHRFVWGIYQKK